MTYVETTCSVQQLDYVTDTSFGNVWIIVGHCLDYVQDQSLPCNQFTLHEC
jgi:hypothetical protein